MHVVKIGEAVRRLEQGGQRDGVDPAVRDPVKALCPEVARAERGREQPVLVDGNAAALGRPVGLELGEPRIRRVDPAGEFDDPFVAAVRNVRLGPGAAAGAAEAEDLVQIGVGPPIIQDPGRLRGQFVQPVIDGAVVRLGGMVGQPSQSPCADEGQLGQRGKAGIIHPLLCEHAADQQFAPAVRQRIVKDPVKALKDGLF